MNFRYGLLLPAMLVSLLFVGSVSAVPPVPIYLLPPTIRNPQQRTLSRFKHIGTDVDFNNWNNGAPAGARLTVANQYMIS